MKKIMLPVLASAVLLSGCSKDNPNQTMGTLIGGAGGAAVGSLFGKGSGQLVGVAVGTLAGAYLGSQIGKDMDEKDKQQAAATAQHNLETAKTGQSSSWHNPDTGHSGTVTPTKTYQKSSGEYCREYQQTVTVGGKTENAYGTACRQPDGFWKVVS